MSEGGKKDLVTDAKSFCDSLGNVFVVKKRDAQSRHLLNQAKCLIESLLEENQRLSSVGGTPRVKRSGGSMGQLWMKLDEMKRENEELKRQLGKSHDERPAVNKSQGPGEVIIAEMHKTKAENVSLKSELDKIQKTLQEMNMINTNLQDEYKRLRIALDTANQSLEHSRCEYKSLENSLTNAKKENELLKQRLSSSPAKPPIAARRDNRQVENINEQCRPSIVARKYDRLESQEWLDAKESLEDTTNRDEEEIVKFLCFMLMNVYQASKIVYENLEETISTLLKHPTRSDAVGHNGLPPGKAELSEDIKDEILMALRRNYEEIETTAIVNIAISRAEMSEEFTSFMSSCTENKTVSRYLHECSRITWQMVIQNPAMRLTVADAVFNEDRHRLWWSCDKKQKQGINFFIWPALYDYNNGVLMVKGCVHAS
ncbi:Hypothetical predicted protein [Octopus vulgaris]|nr:Hypothetical predicted protein [Octopus vulgaris]